VDALINLILSIKWHGLSRLMAPDFAGKHNARVEWLLGLGEAALRRGDAGKAHRIWREAARLAPYDERVWVALLHVLDREDDRRVCLQNIIAINPLNDEARRLLRRYGE
jgi:Tfp pilus assembly protein PilF